ncbi:MAG TPA: carbon-nitrogen hydrolase family protein [Candidatus Sulfomarinibacteraceae bacterium]|nr:carbon-nitrogen hydrolase family protein [Candidatus Sulfomarinibacteraceae bacterium]
MNPKREVNVTVCQLRSDEEGLVVDWERLHSHLADHESDLVLLPEMPFYPWPFWQQPYQDAVWQASVAAHAQWQERLSELPAAVVLGTQPVNDDGQRYNRAFVWESGVEEIALQHTKYYLPDEAGFWEASWYARGNGSFEPVSLHLPGVGEVSAGFLICTELWFMHKARAYGQAGVHLLLTPRATEKRTVDKWLAAGRTAATIAGAFSLSSNHYRRDNDPVSLGGLGWVIGPDGEVLALTTPTRPFATVRIDLAQAERAKHTYPRYVEE